MAIAPVRAIHGYVLKRCINRTYVNHDIIYYTVIYRCGRINVTLRGRVRQILDDMVKEGYANTKSEAIRLAILDFGKAHGSEEDLDLQM